MPEYDNTNSGALFVNDRKIGPNHPDYRGSINVEGVEYWCSAWIKAPRSGGAKFLSLSLTAKEAAAPGQQRAAPAKNDAADFLNSGPVASAAERHKAANRDSRGDMGGRPSSPPDRANRAPHANDNLQAQDFDSFDDDIPF